MIRSFGARNFLSIKDRVAIELEIGSKATDAENIFIKTPDGKRFPSVIAIYGANAAGKTSFLSIPRFLADFIANSAFYPPELSIAVFPFLSKDTTALPSELSASFDLPFGNGDVATYWYELQATQDKVQSEVLRFAAAGSNRKLLFQRTLDNDRYKFEFGPAFRSPNVDSLAPQVGKKASLISFLSISGHPIALQVRTAAMLVFSNILAYGRQQFPAEDVATKIYKDNQAAKRQLLDFIRFLDIGITDMDFKELDSKDIQGRPNKVAVPTFSHSSLSRPLDFHEESHGTRALYIRFPSLMGPLDTGGIAIIDEFDSDLHPLVIPKIIDLFHSKDTNKKGAQLFFSGHNPYTLSFLEKEEVYFAEKNLNGETSFFGLRDVSGVRRADNYFLKYLSGSYGAVPRL